MNTDIYQHVRVMVSILVGFSFTHLLTGAARLAQHPGRQRRYFVHLIWALFVFFYILAFWWWEFRLERVPAWNFPLYLLVTVYGITLYLLCALLFPNDITDYDGFEDYFYQRRGWFFGTFAFMWVIDYADTVIKGRTRLHDLGLEYDVRVILFLVCSLIAMRTRHRTFHAAFATVGLVYEISFILRNYLLVT